MQIAVERGPRAPRPNLKLGICGEHGGDPATDRASAQRLGLDYVSCSPYPRADRAPRRRAGLAQSRGANG